MPQPTLFEDERRPGGVTVKWEEVITPTGTVWNCVVRMKVGESKWKTVHASQWSGYMLDFAQTFATEVHSAYFFGDDRDVVRSAAHTTKMARAHARRHQRVGS